MPTLQVNAGDLRTSITFQQSTISIDAGGFQSQSYTNVSTKPTEKVQWINDHGQESVATNVEVSVQRATVRGRYRNDILESWRVLKNSEPWRIISIDFLQNRRWYELRVERIKATS